MIAAPKRQPEPLLMSAQHPPHPSSLSVTLQILSIVFYTFIAFICIGLPIAVLPGYVHDQLGFSAVVAGLTIASQYLATLLTRPSAGRIVDKRGTKPAVVYGLIGIAISVFASVTDLFRAAALYATSLRGSAVFTFCSFAN